MYEEKADMLRELDHTAVNFGKVPNRPLHASYLASEELELNNIELSQS